MAGNRKSARQYFNYFLRRSRFSPFLLRSVLKSFILRDSVPIDLLLSSRLLVDTDNKIALLWTPKVGSTFAVKWLFTHKGLLNDALRYHEFIHNYRNEVYRYSEEHRRSLNAYMQNPDDFVLIKVVRNPLKRAVSSFIHANKVGDSDNEISTFLGRSLTPKHRFSFREFVHYLESVDIFSCDVHYRSQVNPYEFNGIIKVDRIIDLDNANEQLRSLEKTLGLPLSNVTRISKSKHHTIRVSVDGFYGDTIDFFGKKGVEIPNTRNFFDDELVNRIGVIYAEDFKRYAYQCSLDVI